MPTPDRKIAHALRIAAQSLRRFAGGGTVEAEPFEQQWAEPAERALARQAAAQEAARFDEYARRIPSVNADPIAPFEPFTQVDERIESRPESQIRKDIDAWRRYEGGPELQDSYLMPVVSAADQVLGLGRHLSPKGLYDLTTMLPGAIAHSLHDAATLPGDAYSGSDPKLWEEDTGRLSRHGGERVGNLVTALPLGVGAARVAGAQLVDDAVAAPSNAVGIFGGRLAKTADHEALARAEAMEAKGVDRDTIWRDTGWGRGRDGGWRFEIDDSKARLKGYLQPGATADGALGELMPHADLYAGYPGAANIEAKYGNASGGVRGRFSPGEMGDEGTMAFSGGTPSVALHEAQHYVQGMERFGEGGNPANFQRSRVPASQIDWGGGLDDLMQRYGAGALVEADARQTLNNLFDAAKRDERPDAMSPIINEMNRIDKMTMSPADQYQRLAGEVEARTVQKRMDLTADERRARPMWEDYDVPEADQIVRRGGDGTAFSNADTKTGRAAAAGSAGFYRNDQTPFYGKDVGPRGQIADPGAEVQRLGLQAGLPNAPTSSGFFNPASAALLQAGVAPRQTVTYFEKQFGSRGGKLPPGQWAEITKDLRPDDVVDRDWLVREIDKRTPQIELRRYADEDSKYFDSDDFGDSAGYESWATDLGKKGRDYTETAVGYRTPSSVGEYTINDSGQSVPVGGPAMSNVSPFKDAHFSHPNLEGWYRHQDMFDPKNKRNYDIDGRSYQGDSNVRIIDEVQPQRYQKLRDKGEGVSQAQLNAWSRERDAAKAEIDVMSKRFLALAPEPERLSALAVGSGGSLRKNIARLAERHGVPKDEIARYISLDDKVRHIDGQIIAGKQGVASSPYTHDVQAATGILNKQALIDASRDGIDRIAWAPGEVQAERYNKLMRDISGVRYTPDERGGLLQVSRSGEGRYGSGWDTVEQNVRPEKLADYVGSDAARQLLAQDAAPYYASEAAEAEGRIAGRGHTLNFPDGMTLGGDGMNAFYGDGTTPGIMGSNMQSLLRRVGQENTALDTRTVDRIPVPHSTGSTTYPSLPLEQSTRDTIKRTGLPIYANADSKAGTAAAVGNAFGFDDLDRASQQAIGRAYGLPFDDKMAVMHNLTEGNLAFADQKFGGKLPVPSIAVAKGSHPIQGFGDVSLIGEPAMAKPAANNPVFAADGYTKRFPNTALDFPTRESERIAKKQLERALGREVKFTEFEYLKDQMKRDELDRDGLLAEAYLRSKGVDVPADEYMIKRKADDLGGFNEFANSFFGDDLIRRRIYKYSDRTGDRINRPFTLENVVKEMKGGAAKEGFDYGLGNLRAATTPQFRTIDGIQRERGRLQRSEQWRPDAEAVTKAIGDFADSLPHRYASTNPRDSFRDYEARREGVGYAIKNPSKYREELSYQFDTDNLPSDTLPQIMGLRDQIRNLGTDYFEVKPQRAVGINEFTGALVPEKSAEQVSSLLKKYGIDNVATYDGTPAGRNEALKRFENIMFSNADTKQGVAAALGSGLDMSVEARQARAREMGFDTDKTWFHGTGGGERWSAPQDADGRTILKPPAFEAFDDAKIGSQNDGGHYGRGHYLVNNPGEAAYYGQHVSPFYARGRMLDLDNYSNDYTSVGYFKDFAPKLDAIGALGPQAKQTLDSINRLERYVNENVEVGAAINSDGSEGYIASVKSPQPGYPTEIDSFRGKFHETKEEAIAALQNRVRYEMENYHKDKYPGIGDHPASLSDYIRVGEVNARELTAKSKAAGYDSISVADELIVFDPRNIRSTDAAFDPSRADSTNLLAANRDTKASAAAALANAQQRTDKTPFFGREVDPLGYFSGALEAAKNLKQAKGTPEQMLAQLKAGGAKQAELEATGLLKWIEEKSGSRGSGADAGSGAVIDPAVVGPNGDRTSGTSGRADRLKQPSISKSEIIEFLEKNRVGVKEKSYDRSPPNERELANLRRNSGSEDDILAAEVGLGDDPSAPLDRTKWSSHSLDPSNPTYRETVIHLPMTREQFVEHPTKPGKWAISSPDGKMLMEVDGTVRAFSEPRQEIIDNIAKGDGFRETFQPGHFPEPNIVGHMMTSMTKHEGRPVFTIDQIQSDWGQKLRDGGVRDEKKIAELKAKIAPLEAARIEAQKAVNLAYDKVKASNKNNPDSNSWDWTEYTEAKSRAVSRELSLLEAELRTAEATPPGHPLVNTTDQWTNTTLRRALRQAAEADADYIAVPSGSTVLSYNPGDAHGMTQFYGSTGTTTKIENDAIRARGETPSGERIKAEQPIEGIVPKNLRKLLSALDKDSPKPVKIEQLETPTKGMAGNGFTLFPLTREVKDAVLKGGQALFSNADSRAGVAGEVASDALDMSHEARMARAREMGFDTDNVLYHGTGEKFDEFVPSNGGGYGSGVYTSSDDMMAKHYAGDSGVVMPLMTRGRILDRRDVPTHVERRDAPQWARANGYSGFKDGSEVVVFDPKNIRSVDAVFDPAKADSANLLAANPSTGLDLATILGSPTMDERQAKIDRALRIAGGRYSKPKKPKDDD